MLREVDYSPAIDLPTKKDERAREEERDGIISFRPVRNEINNDKESLIILTGLKNIFQKQLPNMPREYISRLVYDKNHRSLAIVKPTVVSAKEKDENGTGSTGGGPVNTLNVVGGITYRLFLDQHFAEIVFCAITSSEQVRGYGSYLMNKLKEHVKTEGDIRHFLTYADNYATGYFRKQGFTDVISLDKSVWVGFIKDYDGGTLMQCTMVPKVDYLDVYNLIEKQKRALFERMKQKSKFHLIYPGLQQFKKARIEEVPIASIPGVLEAGWTQEMSKLTERERKGKVYEFLRPLLTELQNHPASWPFAEPVNGKEVTDYYLVIKNPMDLKTMEDKLEAETYKNIDEFTHDAQLIFDNCRSYNHESTQYYKCADRLETYFKSRLEARKAMEVSKSLGKSPTVTNTPATSNELLPASSTSLSEHPKSNGASESIHARTASPKQQ